MILIENEGQNYENEIQVEPHRELVLCLLPTSCPDRAPPHFTFPVTPSTKAYCHRKSFNSVLTSLRPPPSSFLLAHQHDSLIAEEFDVEVEFISRSPSPT